MCRIAGFESRRTALALGNLFGDEFLSENVVPAIHRVLISLGCS